MPLSINMLGACDGLDTRNATSGRGCRVRRPVERCRIRAAVADAAAGQAGGTAAHHRIARRARWIVPCVAHRLPMAPPAAGVWDEMLHVLRMAAREAEGREASPSAAIIDSQSVKTTERGGRAAGMPARR